MHIDVFQQPARAEYLDAFDEWAAQQALPGEDRGDGLLPSADAVGDGYTGEASWMDEEFEGGTGRRPAPAGVTADDALVGSDLPGFGAQAAVQPTDPDRPRYVGSPSNLLEQAGVWAGSGLAVPHEGAYGALTQVHQGENQRGEKDFYHRPEASPNVCLTMPGR